MKSAYLTILVSRMLQNSHGNFSHVTPVLEQDYLINILNSEPWDWTFRKLLEGQKTETYYFSVPETGSFTTHEFAKCKIDYLTSHRKF